MKIIVNGEISNKVHIDSSFFFGRGVFETILIKDKPIFLHEHIERLNEGAKRLGINRELEEGLILEQIQKHSIKNCALKIMVTDKNIVMTTREVPYREEMYELGFKLGLSDVKRNSTSMLSYIKSVNYIENLIEKEKAKVNGFDEVIFLNEKNHLTEGSSSNIFFIKGEKIYTPKVSCGLLDGIIRKWVISNFNVNEGEFTLEKFLECDGAFLTNSLMGIMKISSINSKIMNSCNLTERIAEDYREFLGGK